MTWTYSSSQLNLPIYQIRLMIGDIYSCDPQIQDEEISYFLSKRGTNYGAAAECCRSLAARMSRSFDQKAGTASVSYSQMAKAYFQKANNFEVLATQVAGQPYFGGTSIFDKFVQTSDPDRPPANFSIGMHDNYLPVPPATEENIRTLED
jgi:hypothetical protein